MQYNKTQYYNNLSYLWNLIKVTIKIPQKLQKQRDNQYLDKVDTGQRTMFADGSYVLVDYRDNKYYKGPPNKLLTHLRGPLKVISSNKDDYTLENLITRKDEHHHVTGLRKFDFNPNITDPLQVARRDYYSTFIVDKILAHVGNKRIFKSKWDFKVRWQGYDETEDLWLPYSEVKDLEVFHTYVTKNNLPKFLIPQKYKSTVTL